MVMRHLYVILMFVFLNKFVILRICGEMYVKIGHFLFLSCGEMCFVLCCIWCLSLCIIAGGKPFCWAICRIVSHSLCCCVVLSGRLSIDNTMRLLDRRVAGSKTKLVAGNEVGKVHIGPKSL